jgi:hypothetical protein
MKAFEFRLEQARRWREAAVGSHKAHVAAAAERTAESSSLLDSRRAELAEGAMQVTRAPDGHTLACWAAFADRSRGQISDLQNKALAAQQALAAEMRRMIEANRKLRLVENLRKTGYEEWRRDFDRELSAFADEAFLSRSALAKLQSKKRTGA